MNSLHLTFLQRFIFNVSLRVFFGHISEESAFAPSLWWCFPRISRPRFLLPPLGSHILGVGAWLWPPRHGRHRPPRVYRHPPPATPNLIAKSHDSFCLNIHQHTPKLLDSGGLICLHCYRQTRSSDRIRCSAPERRGCREPRLVRFGQQNEGTVLASSPLKGGECWVILNGRALCAGVD